ncbi:MAG: arginine--tRNA ligase [Spirochaetaceae bacterium]|jgi:arginyl-tRNA synthetase|nr:arginine--tRNA ligase [Spirochaetaceae bacterium]
MVDFQTPWKRRIAGILNLLLEESGSSQRLGPGEITLELPPRPEMGDLGFPMFGYAKLLRRAPPAIAGLVVQRLAAAGETVEASGAAGAEGPYVNVRLDRAAAAVSILEALLDETRPVGRPGNLAGSRIMVEFSSPNTNKPLHLGHLRNDVLGESISRILGACGARVRKVCIINDRGIHICKSMLAYMEQGQGKTPESEGIKSDHFVGDWYVAFNRELKKETENLMQQRKLKKEEAEAAAPIMLRAQELLRQWEAGDTETVACWKMMNHWTIEGMKATYERTGVSFDQYYFESETYLKGREEILRGLEGGIFSRAEDGAVVVDLEEEKLGKKILLRSDGTSIYITQDIGLAIYRNQDWPFDRLVYVVGSEQQYHFKVLFTVLKKLGFSWANNLYHLSYGMVNLPEGKMKSREGTVVDADDLIDTLRDMALEEIREKDREEAVKDPPRTAEKIALGALHYYLLSVSPGKDMLFDPRGSLSFTGDTGPYLQYMGARISSMLRRAGECSGSARSPGPGTAGAEHPHGRLTGDPEWELLKALGDYDAEVAAAAEGMDPSLLKNYLYRLSKAFSRFYHDCPILQAETPELSAARLALSRAVLRVLKDALSLICIPFLETM